MKLNRNTLPLVIVAPETLGDRLRLYGVYPAYAYRDGQRTTDLIGYTYIIACSGLGGAQLGVRIPGKQQLGAEAIDHLIQLDGLDLRIYPSYVTGQHGIDAIGIKASAKNISIIDG